LDPVRIQIGRLNRIPLILIRIPSGKTRGSDRMWINKTGKKFKKLELFCLKTFERDSSLR
jgi:hypothetical protein